METTEKTPQELLLETYQQYQTAQQCEQKIRDNQQKIQELQKTLENLQVKNITEGIEGISNAIKKLQKENENIKKLLAYLHEQRTQINELENKEEESSKIIGNLDPARAETKEDRIATLKLKREKLENMLKDIQLLLKIDEEPISNLILKTNKSIRDTVEGFYDQEIGQKREIDEKLGLIPTETEKMLMEFFAQQTKSTQQPEETDKNTLKKFSLSKEYRTLKKEYNEMIKDIKDPIISAFVETEFAKITQESNPQEQQNWLEALKNFIASSKYSSDTWTGYVQAETRNTLSSCTTRNLNRHQKGIPALLKGEGNYNIEQKRLDLLQRYILLGKTQEGRYIASSLPSYAIVRLLQKNELQEFDLSLENDNVINNIFWNEHTGTWNFTSEQFGKIESGIVNMVSEKNRDELQQKILNEIKNITRELLPAINAKEAIRTAQDYPDKIIDQKYGLRSSTTQGHIESTLEGSDTINMAGQITCLTTKKTVQEQEKRKGNLLEALGKPERNEGLLATMGNIIDKLIKNYELIAPNYQFDTNPTYQKKQYEGFQEELAKALKEAQDLKNAMEEKGKEKKNINWWKQWQHMKKVELANIQRDLERIQEAIRSLRTRVINWTLGKNSKFTINLDVPKANASIETIETILQRSNDFFKQQINQLTEKNQEKEAESAELFTQYQKISSECTQIINELTSTARNESEKNRYSELSTSFNKTVNRLNHCHTFFCEITKKQEQKKVDTEPEPR